MILTDMVARCRLLAAHGASSCLSARAQPLTATGAPSQTSTIPYVAECGGCALYRMLLLFGPVDVRKACFGPCVVGSKHCRYRTHLDDFSNKIVAWLVTNTFKGCGPTHRLCTVWYGMLEVCEGAPRGRLGWSESRGLLYGMVWYGMVWYGISGVYTP